MFTSRIFAGGGLDFIRKIGVKSLAYWSGTIRDATFNHKDNGITWTLEVHNKDAKWGGSK